jgi:hypothetical protein
MTFEILSHQNWNELIDICRQEKMHIPSPVRSRVVVARDDNGQIVGLGVIQQVTHVEPFWIKKSHRSIKLLRELWNRVVGMIGVEQVVVHTSVPTVGKLLERLGFNKHGEQTLYLAEETHRRAL